MTSQALDTDTQPDRLTEPLFQKYRDLIHGMTGISLAPNKRDLVQSRLISRLRVTSSGTFGDYYRLVTSDPDGAEMQELINRITTNKTHFFREMHHFDRLRNSVFPRIIDEASRGLRPKKLRIWCAAASTGEEPYSLAIAVQEAFSGLAGWDLRILASDIDTRVLEQARSAKYHADQLLETPLEVRQSYFIRGTGEDSDRFLLKPDTARRVTFRQVNLLAEEWPIRTRFDVIFCRNVLIYFDPPTQDRLMRRLADFLMPDGSLFIGHSESLARLPDTYVRVGKTVYQHAAINDQHAPGRRTSIQKTNRQPEQKLPRTSIVVGDVFASKSPHEVGTTLGSCIAVCLYDARTGIGGMNHFALPTGVSCRRKVASFGVHAMELLINEIMRLGGNRLNLQAKVFGGANLLSAKATDGVGARNSQFIREFLSTESIPIVSEYLGGDRPMKVLFEPHTGRARMKLLERSTAQDVSAPSTPRGPQPAGEITLF